MRIVSLLPSATEIVCALGARDELVGRSHECDVEELPICTEPRICVDGDSNEIHNRVTEALRDHISVYRVDSELLRSLRPDVIITQVQCEVCAVSPRDIEAGAAQIVALSATTVDGIFRDIESVAKAIQRDPQELLTTMRNRIDALCGRQRAQRPKVATIEWLSPLMTAGNWIPELIELAGGENVFGRAGEHSQWIDLEAFVRADPDVIVMFPCGFSIDRTLADLPLLTSQPMWHRLRAVRNGNVFVADGNQYFNRPGPRIVESLEILSEILHEQTADDSLLEQRQGFRVVAAPASLRSAL